MYGICDTWNDGCISDGQVDLSGVTGEDLSAVTTVESGLDDPQTSTAEEEVSDAPEMGLNMDLCEAAEQKGVSDRDTGLEGVCI